MVEAVATDPILRLAEAPDGNADAAITAALRQYNLDRNAGYDPRPLSVHLIRPDTREVVGGLTGRTSHGMLFVDFLVLPAAMRGRGLGRRIMEMAEGAAAARGARTAFLYTLSYQAGPAYYAKLGYREMGRIACTPAGVFRSFMVKSLDPAGILAERGGVSATAEDGAAKCAVVNGVRREILGPELSDAEVASAVRMLERGQIDHEAICTLARDRILYLSQRLAEIEGRHGRR